MRRSHGITVSYNRNRFFKNHFFALAETEIETLIYIAASHAALRLGAESAIGIDIDPKAEDIARENAAYNGFAAPAFTALTGNVTEDTAMMDTLAAGRYDLVLVNIVADVIIGLAPVLPHFLGESSTLICSGILDTRLSDVLEALTAAGLTVTATKAKDDWRCVTAKRIL